MKNVNLKQQDETLEFGLWLRAPSPPRLPEKVVKRGGPRKRTTQSYFTDDEVASDFREVDERGGGNRRRVDRKRVGKDPDVQDSRMADMAKGAGYFNARGDIGGSSMFSDENHETYHAWKAAEKERFDDRELSSRRKDEYTQDMRENINALNGEQLEENRQGSLAYGCGSIEGGSNGLHLNSKLGQEKKGLSSMDLTGYSGPLFSEVEKSLQFNKNGNEGNKGLETTMTTWRKVDYGDAKQARDQKIHSRVQAEKGPSVGKQ